MPKNNVYIHYSGATDITGKKLQAALDITGGAKKPTAAKKFVIGWGCKTKDAVQFPADVTVLNHPNAIRNNRNKFKTLEALRGHNINVANYVKAERVIAELERGDNNVVLPLVGRTNFHQGGKGFWLCITQVQVQRAIREGAQYFQNYMDIKDEYRLHVFQGKVICAQKKVRRNNMEEAYVAQHKEKVQAIAAKNEVALDDDTVDYVLGRLAKGSPFADMIVRSNTRGWKFSQQNIGNLNAGLKRLAADAIEAVDLQFGAVDCCTLENGDFAIIEINSGPGLQATSFDAYVKEMKAWIDKERAPAPKAAEAVEAAVAKPAKAAGKKAPAGGAKAKLKARIAMVEDMLDVADDKEADVL
ncbi:MAG: hypothetical protein U9R24_05760, partial [Thermodesulfobacteriota bacterium]|nr:hypothetical protein [Thermodesulfobacteriota bacterium]